ncbi:unnamed protein product, partial [Staurois parvus]
MSCQSAPGCMKNKSKIYFCCHQNMNRRLIFLPKNVFLHFEFPSQAGPLLPLGKLGSCLGC